MLLQHEIDYIAERILGHLEERIAHIIRKELAMTDQAIVDLTAATDAVVAELSAVVTDLQNTAQELAAALVASGASLDPAIEAQVARLQAGAKAAADAVAALQTPASPSPDVAPAGQTA